MELEAEQQVNYWFAGEEREGERESSIVGGRLMVCYIYLAGLIYDRTCTVSRTARVTKSRLQGQYCAVERDVVINGEVMEKIHQLADAVHACGPARSSSVTMKFHVNTGTGICPTFRDERGNNS